MRRKDMAKRLRCGKVDGLPRDFQMKSQDMTARYLSVYSPSESGYQLDEELVRNRVENLMIDALTKNPELTAREFAAGIKIQEIFKDKDAIMCLVELVEITCEDDWFYFAFHFFSVYVFSFIFHHPYHIKSLDRGEVISVLYHQVYCALKCCSAKKTFLSFKILKQMFNAAVLELSGTEKFPFTIHRKDYQQYNRFRATIRNNNLGIEDTKMIAESLSMTEKKIESYWDIYIMESKGFISTSLLLDDEEADHIFGKVDELGFADAEIMEIRNRLFSREEDRMVFDSLVGNGDGVFTKLEIETINTSRYRINQIKEMIRADRENDKYRPIK